MSVPFAYYNAGSDMSVDLKRVMHRVRTNKSQYFTPKLVRETSMDGDGKVTVTERVTRDANPMTGAERHRLSLQTERF